MSHALHASELSIAARNLRALAEDPQDADAAHWILAFGRAPQALDCRGRRPLGLCCLLDSPAASAAALLRLGADAGERDGAGWTPLHHACAHGRADIARLLLAAGADPDARCPDSSTALHLCAQSGSGECAAALLAAGAFAQPPDDDDLSTPAHWGAADLAWLAAAGVDAPGHPDLHGRGALHWAVRQAVGDRQALAACAFWIQAGADPTRADGQGLCPERQAQARGFDLCAGYLRSIRERAALDSCAGAASGQLPTRL